MRSTLQTGSIHELNTCAVVKCTGVLLMLAAALDESARDNPWAVFDGYIDRVVVQCVNELTPDWATKLAAYDV